jgi:hypothetical protein
MKCFIEINKHRQFQNVLLFQFHYERLFYLLVPLPSTYVAK